MSYQEWRSSNKDLCEALEAKDPHQLHKRKKGALREEVSPFMQRGMSVKQIQAAIRSCHRSIARLQQDGCPAEDTVWWLGELTRQLNITRQQA